MSEKNTDYYMQKAYESIFNHEYHTEANNELFSQLIPDGWDIINDTLIIIENKRLIKDKTKGRNQLFTYYDKLRDNIKDNIEFSNYDYYLILGLGNNKKSFKYLIYDADKQETKLTLQDVYDKMQIKTGFSEKDIRNLNQYLYDNSITLSKSQKTLFIASVLISLKIDDKILDGYDESTNSFLIADRMIDIINNYYEDPLFTNNFNFIKKSIHNKHLYHIFNVINIDIKKYGKDILNQFYSEFCIWDRNNDGKLGIVLTPDDIVDIIVNESFKYYYELNGNKDNIKVIDFCMGTGSFLIKSSNYTKLLYGCENGDERYSLAKCNFILNDLDYNNLKYDSCFNVKYNNNYFDISIINPPFSNRCQDELNPNNTTNWKSYTKEQRFIMYQLELLKVGGIGCCIVPRSNFNNSVKKINDFKYEFMKQAKILKYYKCNDKVFMPNASVECVIIIYQKINKLDNPLDSNVEFVDYSNDGFKITNNTRIKNTEPKLITSNKTLSWNDDFNYVQDNNESIDIVKLIKRDQMDKIYYDGINQLEKLNDTKEFDNNLMKVKLSDFLEPIKLKTFKVSEDGIYPLYGATKLNKETGKCNSYSIDTYNNEDSIIKLNGLCLIGKTGNGGAGYLNIYKGKFGITSTVLPCKIKTKLSDLNLSFISVQLHKVFSRFNNFTLKDLNTEVNVVMDESLIKPFEIRIDDIDESDFKIKEWKEFKISDLMDLLPNRKLIGNKETPKGPYPLISTAQFNYGIIKYVNNYEYDGENHKYITCAMTGSSGSSFYQPFKFMVTDRVRVLEIKENVNFDPKIIALIMNHLLTKRYSYTNGLSINKLMNEIIKIPIFE